MKTLIKLTKITTIAGTTLVSLCLSANSFAELPKTVFQNASPLDQYVGTYASGTVSTTGKYLPRFNYCHSKFTKPFTISKQGDKYIISGSLERVECKSSIPGLCDKICPQTATIANEVTLDANGTSARFSMDKDYNAKGYDKDSKWSCKINNKDPKGDACVSVKLDGATLKGSGVAGSPHSSFDGDYQFNAEKSATIRH